jgi:hypothetical protein
MTQKLTPQQSNVIPAGKFIYTDETFLVKPPTDPKGESFPRQGKELIPAHFSYGHHNPDFTPVAGGTPIAQNFNTYIYNAQTGFV